MAQGWVVGLYDSLVLLSWEISVVFPMEAKPDDSHQQKRIPLLPYPYQQIVFLLRSRGYTQWLSGVTFGCFPFLKRVILTGYMISRHLDLDFPANKWWYTFFMCLLATYRKSVYSFPVHIFYFFIKFCILYVLDINHLSDNVQRFYSIKFDIF